MPQSPLADRRNLSFLLHEVLRVESLLELPRFASHSRESFDAAVDLAHELALAHFLPHNRASDVREPHMRPDGSVAIIPEVKAALDAYAKAGFMATIADESLGGMQLPMTIATACDGLFMAANISTSGYALLARGAADLIRAHGTPEQQARYMRPILDGRYLGTMCLSEPQAGSSLADITTVAEPQPDGTYRLRGAKMWISGGDHELADNIVHMVLAKIPGGPPGVKGISLFIVPRYLVAADGTRGARNDIVLAGVNHKLGQRGIVNTFLKLGENDRCVGELVGAPHQGLPCMFHMMNAARIGVGVGAVMLGSAGYLHSLAYAKERKQGRPLGAKDPATPPVPIIEHADVRRMLLQQKAWVEGGLALVLYAGTLVDRQGVDGGIHGQGERPRDPGARRLRLHARISRRAVLARQPVEPDPRGHERDPGAGSARPQADGTRRRLADKARGCDADEHRRRRGSRGDAPTRRCTGTCARPGRGCRDHGRWCARSRRGRARAVARASRRHRVRAPRRRVAVARAGPRCVAGAGRGRDW
jgi:alkylation response protein AidB-like acyl-CoA dehydrogenase